MPFIYIDRRKAGRGKSAPNRQKLMKRIRNFIKMSKPTTIGKGSVASNSNAHSNPVQVAGDALEEPRFAYAKGGTNTMVVNGNPKYQRGDEIDMEGEGPGKGGSGPGDGGEDDFIVNVASDEFLDLFFEDCELPNLTNEKITERLDNKKSHAGFSTQGNPAQLSVIRSYKQMMGRRRALSSPYRTEREQIEARLKEIYDSLAEDPELDFQEELDTLEARLIAINRKITGLEGFDKVDLRYRKKEHKPLHTVQAVLVMVMDISGSMDQEKKTIARRWFALLYAFIKRRYSSCELIFIAHTDDVFEMSENDFFSTRMNGGTMVSPALEEINRIIISRYDPTETNIYISHASDGDNWDSDTPATIEAMKKVMPKIQHFSYVEVGIPWMAAYNGSSGTGRTESDSVLWSAYAEVAETEARNRLSMSVIEKPEECYKAFKDIFRK
jgi:uncharacterized sporulation protein YeaH/YhbH (DUF444 family)